MRMSLNDGDDEEEDDHEFLQTTNVLGGFTDAMVYP